MIQNRAIPCLLLHKNEVYKTTKFKKPNYIGDPINAIRILNEKEVDELVVLDIDASSEKRAPNFELISDMAGECFMPLCYGGGVKNIEEMEKIYSLGVEKISLSSSAVLNPKLVSEASRKFGAQSVVVTIDIGYSFWTKTPMVYIYNGKKKTKFDVFTFVKMMEEKGAGEIVINSIENDGKMNGYDIKLMKKVTDLLNIPVIAMGGAGSLEDLAKVIKCGGVTAAAAGSLFVYYGPLKGVLINYPSQKELRKVLDLTEK